MRHPSIVTIGAKVPAELALAVDRAILSDPMRFKDRSELVRTAIIQCLQRLGLWESPSSEKGANAQTPIGETSESLNELFFVNHKKESAETRRKSDGD